MTAVDHWWTAEDDRPGRVPWISLYAEGSDDEMLRIELPVRVAWWYRRKVQLVIRASVSGEITASLQAIRVE